jgi:Amt family ammonium transporter
MNRLARWTTLGALLLGSLFTTLAAQAQSAPAASASAVAATVATAAPATPAFNGADTAWMLISTVLVMIMTMPGIMLFYGGMLRSKNALSIVAGLGSVTPRASSQPASLVRVSVGM